MSFSVEDIRVETTDTQPGTWWDDALAESPGSSPTVYATRAYVEHQREWECVAPLYLTARDPAGRVLGQLALWSEYPFNGRTNSWRSGPALAGIGRALLPSIGWMCPPVVHCADQEIQIHAALSVAVQEIRDRIGVVWVRPGPLRALRPDGLSDLLEVWHKVGLPTQPTATLCVDLAADLETIHSRLRRSARKALRKADSAGLRVRRVDTDGLTLRQYDDMALQARQFFSHGARRWPALTALWQRLHTTEGTMEYFLAEHDGKPLAGLGVLLFGGVAVEVESWKMPGSDLPAGDAIKWAVVQHARQAGCRWYDLAGVDPDPQPGSKEANIRRFKEKWGGTLWQTATADSSDPTPLGLARLGVLSAVQRCRRAVFS